jgi:hypothetical protein
MVRVRDFVGMKAEERFWSKALREWLGDGVVAEVLPGLYPVRG